MFRLTSEITIDKYTLRGGVNEVTIKRSVNEIIDTATIKVPGIGRVISANGVSLPVSSIETATLFKEGDPVQIRLGYNGELKQEFAGFVRRVNLSVPVALELEGYAWQLRRKHVLKSWKNTTLRGILETITEGTDIILSDSIPSVNLTNFSIRNSNGLQVLEYLRDKMLLAPYFHFNELYVGLQQGVIRDKATVCLGWNVIRDDGLKVRLAEDTRVLVRIMTGRGKKNRRVLYETGDKGGSLVEHTLPNVTDMKWVKELAESALKQAKYTGYEGDVNCFLQPYVEPSGSLQIIDRKYSKRDGLFFVNGTEVSFGMRGARRKVHLGAKLS